jgi:hypothetical protein
VDRGYTPIPQLKKGEKRMNSNEYANILYDTVDMIVTKVVGEAKYDVTIEAIVKEETGKDVSQNVTSYQVQYQDSEFEAFASGTNSPYKPGDAVMVLIPGNDMNSSNKTIVGG